MATLAKSAMFPNRSLRYQLEPNLLCRSCFYAAGTAWRTLDARLASAGPLSFRSDQTVGPLCAIPAKKRSCSAFTAYLRIRALANVLAPSHALAHYVPARLAPLARHPRRSAGGVPL